MRVLTILGSPRKAGNTAHVLGWVEQTLKEADHKIERVDLCDFSINGCKECFCCRKGNVELCAADKDDANRIMQKMQKADIILIASPVFCWGFPSHLKALLDRMYCMVEDYESNPNYDTKLMDKPMALLATCGGPEEGNAELMIRGFYAMQRFMKAKPLGHLLYPFFRKPTDLTAQDKARAVDFALRLVAI